MMIMITTIIIILVNIIIVVNSNMIFTLNCDVDVAQWAAVTIVVELIKICQDIMLNGRAYFQDILLT